MGKTSIYALCILCAICAVLTSCDNIVDYNDGYTPAELKANAGAPEITAVYAAGDTALITPITEGELGEMVRIEGRNLNHAKRVSFNTVEVDLTKIYTASTYAIVQIPGTLSTARVNQIEYTTDRGTATFDFVIPFPDLTVTGLLNEFAQAGMTVKIVGQNFDLYGFDSSNATVSVDGEAVEVSNVTSTSMEVLIPSSTGDNTDVVLSWQNASRVTMTRSLPFRPTRRLLFNDLAAVQRDKTDEHVTVEDAQTLHWTGSLPVWSWIELSFSQNMSNLGIDLANIDNLCFVFEVQNASQYPFATAGYKFGWNWNGWDNCHWQPGDGAGLNTFGEWQTVRIPLSSLAPDGVGNVGDWTTLNVLFQPVTDYAADFRMANFRIQSRL